MPDHRHLYEIAESQTGYFTVETRRFLRVERGIYRLALFPHSPYEDLFAAWLRMGPHAVISHESVLALYDLPDVLPDQIHMIIPRTASRRREGIRFHTHRLEPDEVTRYQGLPVTMPARTIAEVIATGIDPDQVARPPQPADPPQGGLRFQVESFLDSRIFERFHLDVGVNDPLVGPPDQLTMPPLLAFADPTPFPPLHLMA